MTEKMQESQNIKFEKQMQDITEWVLLLTRLGEKDKCYVKGVINGLLMKSEQEKRIFK